MQKVDADKARTERINAAANPNDDLFASSRRAIVSSCWRWADCFSAIAIIRSAALGTASLYFMSCSGGGRGPVKT
jgi:hypothetical protein